MTDISVETEWVEGVASAADDEENTEHSLRVHASSRARRVTYLPGAARTGGTMQVDLMAVGHVHLIAAIICAKWALDLGFSQTRQLLWAIAGLVAAPLILLILYVRLIREGLA